MRLPSSLLILVLTSPVRAVPVDSFPLPPTFHLIVNANGAQHHWSYVLNPKTGYFDSTLDYGFSAYSQLFDIGVTNIVTQDTNPEYNGNSYHFSHDSLICSTWRLNFDTWIRDSLLIVFDTLRREVQKLKYDWRLQYEGLPCGSTASYCEWKGLEFRNLQIADDSILCADSILDHYLVSSGHRLESIARHGGADFYEFLTATSLDLSGIFRPTHLASLASVAQMSAPPLMTFAFLRGVLTCSFATSDHPRLLELYTPLGVRVASPTILPGDTRLSLTHLLAGLYYVRMDDAVSKVIVYEP